MFGVKTSHWISFFYKANKQFFNLINHHKNPTLHFSLKLLTQTSILLREFCAQEFFGCKKESADSLGQVNDAFAATPNFVVDVGAFEWGRK